jgi:hypothetical protein
MKIIAALIFLCISSIAYAAEPPRLPQGITCEMVRSEVAKHGRVYAYTLARLHGFSTVEIAEAKKCLWSRK